MADLQVGDKVQVAPGVFSEVYMFSHRYEDAVASFVKLTTSTGAELLITADHYLYVNGNLAVASTVKVCPCSCLWTRPI